MNDHFAKIAGGPANGVYSGPKVTSSSSICSAEEALRAARELAYRVEHIIDRFCGSDGIAGGPCETGETMKPPVLIRLRHAAEDTEIAVRRANAALDRLDVELN